MRCNEKFILMVCSFCFVATIVLADGMPPEETIPKSGTVGDVIKKQKQKLDQKSILKATNGVPGNKEDEESMSSEGNIPESQALINDNTPGNEKGIVVIKGKDERIKDVHMVGVIGVDGQPLLAVLEYQGSTSFVSAGTLLFGGWKVRMVYETFIDLVNNNGSLTTLALSSTSKQSKESNYEIQKKYILKPALKPESSGVTKEQPQNLSKPIPPMNNQ